MTNTAPAISGESKSKSPSTCLATSNVPKSSVSVLVTTIVQVTHSEENAGYGNRVVKLRDGWLSS